MRDVNFLGTTNGGSTVYLSLTTFLRILFWSSRKLGSGFTFISVTLFLQNWSHCCSFLSTSKMSFTMLKAGVPGSMSVDWTSSMMFLITSSTAGGTSSLPLSWYRQSVLSWDITSATTFFYLGCAET